KTLSHAVYARSKDQIRHILRCQPQRTSDGLTVVGNHLTVSRAVQLARLGSAGEGFDGLAQDHKIAPFIITAHLLERRKQFFQVLGTSVLTLQKAFNVTRDELPLHGSSFAIRKFFRS